MALFIIKKLNYKLYFLIIFKMHLFKWLRISINLFIVKTITLINSKSIKYGCVRSKIQLDKCISLEDIIY